MEEEEKRTVAYVCPECRQTVIASTSVFRLAASPSRFPCPCGKSEVTINPMGDRSDLKIPCLFCGREHTVSCRTRDLLRQRCMAFSCSQSGLNCCFIGAEEEVTKAAARLEQTLDKLPPEGEERDVFLDPVVMEETLAEIRDIGSRDGISCTCGSRQWRMKVHYSIVDLICAKCGGVLRLNAATQEDLADLCCHYTLEIQGQDNQKEEKPEKTDEN
ncbi:MAG: hypothetical protein LUC17_03565 [Oscillospiraceae bacterium]|nr:hypothetical protein [Oscillospiraceae bacterium]